MVILIPICSLINWGVSVPGKRAKSELKKRMNEHPALYYRDIRKFRPLSKERERELARKSREGDLSARQALIEANVKFVILVAQRYKDEGVEFSDLIAAGNLGLCRAAEKFDERHGVHFASYAIWQIRAEIQNYLVAYKNIVSYPNRIAKKAAKTRRIVDEFFVGNGHSPTDVELAKLLGVPIFTIGEIFCYLMPYSSLDTLFAELEDDDNNNRDFSITRWRQALEDEACLPPDQNLWEERRRNEIERALSCLEPKHEEIMRLAFGLDDPDWIELDNKQIGERFNLTRERIRQIIEKALKKFRYKAYACRLRPYWEG